ncbi:3-phytase B precursor [Boeremia exigua]|uniref:3-phytase B precursor n=1 Tax=Boeremia exigua TaxID=749465 RepID=UPI001E8D58D1|nr:3-phytase B precursor [Boeremia exigua]KAH6618457.1 3-phytase B precursor [Boeremia exigua]
MRVADQILFFLGTVATVLSLYYGYTKQCTAPNAQQGHTGYFEYECAGKPHHSSWTSWWHPQRSEGSISERNQGAGTTTKDWNILYHLGGNGPWVEKLIDLAEPSIAVPPGCQVSQVHMMSRHAERYPTKTAGRNQRAVVDKMRNSNISFTGALAFFDSWKLFWANDTSLEHLTTTGPFAGRLGAFTTGVRLRTRYSSLLSRALAQNATNYWASDSPRVIDTARYFAAGFYGLDARPHLHVIPETPDRGADTLTPGRTCPRNLADKQEGKAKGYRLMAEYQQTYLPPIAARLSSQHGLDLSSKDVWAMQELCGFETTVRGGSEWCEVFTQEEFLAFEYARDLLHFYRAGPGQRYAASMGSLWVDATAELMRRGQGAGALFFSFVHDGDIAPMITALDVINDDELLPTTHINHNRKWRKSQVSPMGGRVILEVLECGDTAINLDNGERRDADSRDEQSTLNKFVRLNINDGITAFPDCRSGPGSSCPLAQFLARTNRKSREAGRFAEICEMAEGSGEVNGEGGITFLHQ